MEWDPADAERHAQLWACQRSSMQAGMNYKRTMYRLALRSAGVVIRDVEMDEWSDENTYLWF